MPSFAKKIYLDFDLFDDAALANDEGDALAALQPQVSGGRIRARPEAQAPRKGPQAHGHGHAAQRHDVAAHARARRVDDVDSPCELDSDEEDQEEEMKGLTTPTALVRVAPQWVGVCALRRLRALSRLHAERLGRHRGRRGHLSPLCDAWSGTIGCRRRSTRRGSS